MSLLKRGCNGSSETFTSRFLTVPLEKLQASHPRAVAAAHLFDFGPGPRDPLCGFRKFSFNHCFKFLEIDRVPLLNCNSSRARAILLPSMRAKRYWSYSRFSLFCLLRNRTGAAATGR
jgi:hypothetical protein